MMFGMAIIALASPFSTAGYLGLIAKWSLTPDGPFKTFCARGGTASGGSGRARAHARARERLAGEQAAGAH